MSECTARYTVISPNFWMWKFCGNVSTKFLYQEIRWNFGILRIGCGVFHKQQKKIFGTVIQLSVQPLGKSKEAHLKKKYDTINNFNLPRFLAKMKQLVWLFSHILSCLCPSLPHTHGNLNVRSVD